MSDLVISMCLLDSSFLGGSPYYVKGFISMGSEDSLTPVYVPSLHLGVFRSWCVFLNYDLSLNVPAVGSERFKCPTDHFAVKLSAGGFPYCLVYTPVVLPSYTIDLGPRATYQRLSYSFLDRVLVRDGVYVGPEKISGDFKAPAHMRDLGGLKYVAGKLDLSETSVSSFGDLVYASTLVVPRTMQEIPHVQGDVLVIGEDGPPILYLEEPPVEKTLYWKGRVITDLKGLRSSTFTVRWDDPLRHVLSSLLGGEAYATTT